MRKARITKIHQRRDLLVRGALQVVRAVRVTYGPRGRTVMLDRKAGLLSTRDGVTVACEVEPENPVERLGARVLRQACIRLNEEIGDGTSSAIVIAGKLVEAGHRFIQGGVDPAEFVSYLRKSCEALPPLEPLKMEVTSQEFLRQVALHTTKGDGEIAAALAEASMMVGKTGMVVVEDGKGRGVEIVPKQGLEFGQGWESSDFSQSGEPWTGDIVLVAVIDGVLTKFEEIVPLMEAASQVEGGDLPLLVVSQGIYGEALQTMVTNHRKEVMRCCAVRSPMFGPKSRSYLEDIAALAQAEVVDPKLHSLKEFESGWLGSVQQAEVTPERTILVSFESAYESIEDRVWKLRFERERTTSSHDREQLSERIAKLTDGFCLLRVGGVTEAEAKERRGRVEDALHAVRAALREGVVPGAGMTYWWLAEGSEPQGEGVAAQVASQALQEALREPLKAIVTNGGRDSAEIVAGLQEVWMGFDIETGKFRDLAESPALVDPLALVREVVGVAVSVATTLLTAEVSLTR